MKATPKDFPTWGYAAILALNVVAVVLNGISGNAWLGAVNGAGVGVMAMVIAYRVWR